MLMTILKRVSFLCIIIVQVVAAAHSGFSQTQITGKVIDINEHHPLAYVNIGIKEKNIGTVSREDGSFVINIPSQYRSDSLTFSIVGYYESNLSISSLIADENVVVRLNEKATQLEEVVITGEKLVEKKYGIKKRGVIHFTDGMFKKDDSFEIGQVVHLGNSLAQITSLNLHINSSRPDSANFRINFYRFDADSNIPGKRIVEKSILQRHAVTEGWLKFDLSGYNILIKGNVLVSLEFIPETAKDVRQIFYEVKIGGASKSFFRKTSLGQWTRPPHHYCLYVTAITDKNAPDETGDEETPPVFTLKADFSDEPFSLFVRLPRNYLKNRKEKYPVIYLLDGNAYFDAVASSVDSFVKKKTISVDPIVVGIGYANAYLMDSLRSRDYTFPAALPIDSSNISGQGDNFYNFIKTKLVPYIDSAYRTDKANRTIMGHSLGGYFVLYALTRDFADTSVFTNFIAASPSIYYHDYYLVNEIEKSVNREGNEKNFNAYLTLGELELLESQSEDFMEMAKMLADRTVHTQAEVYRKLEHMGTAIPTFENGIKLFMSKQKVTKK
jgi:predicted alpha/beta superfamily hydrolase